MDELLEILQDVTDEVDFKTEEHLIDDGLLNSFDILQIISALDDAYGISIPASEIVPANFNSAKAMLALVNRLQQEG
ncbi:MAG: phosphopantetheine-binding protein [Lachnospiraceae bacterium]|jgi:D-alanine--poly(phosphoribitol) ligase subunit 2